MVRLVNIWLWKNVNLTELQHISGPLSDCQLTPFKTRTSFPMEVSEGSENELLGKTTSKKCLLSMAFSLYSLMEAWSQHMENGIIIIYVNIRWSTCCDSRRLGLRYVSPLMKGKNRQVRIEIHSSRPYVVTGNLFGYKSWPPSRLPGRPSKGQSLNYLSPNVTIRSLRPADQADRGASRVFKQ